MEFLSCKKAIEMSQSSGTEQRTTQLKERSSKGDVLLQGRTA
jgi:hypothetical protein